MDTTDRELIDEFLAATAGMTQARAAKMVGVSQRKVSSWRSGERGALQSRVRSAMVQFLRQSSDVDVLEGARDVESEMWIASLDDIMRTLRKIGPEPGSHTARKKDALRLMRELMATLGESLPDWYWDIQERVERGEL